MKPVDIIVMVLAVVVGLTVSLPLIGILVNMMPYNQERAEMISNLLTSIIAVISLYVGSRLNEGGK